MDKIREELAKFAHNQWSGWMDYLFNKCIEYQPAKNVQAESGAMIIPKWAVDRWKTQIKTDYKDLSEEEKNSDRSEAEGMLKILSRDEELQKWRDRNDKQEARIIDQDVEIQDGKDALTAMRCAFKASGAVNKKLREAIRARNK